ncbi:uncharacterized protein LOC122010725 [Zingiber officinale]|uniref:uncharacterized protein LOC122010725 n=1 Tax=Zingiber officinale TaxID=94328 RepID=UPI001C4DB3FE|nr:uncharacterized protein LOC122010725 [Zingiber officinale]
MPRAHGRGWGSSRARSHSRGYDSGSGRGRGRACQRATTTDHGLDEAPISPSELIPGAQVGPSIGVGGQTEGQPHLVAAQVAVPAIPTASFIMEKARIPLLASSAKDRFMLFHGGTDPWVARTWLEDIEATFGYMSCSDTEKVELAAYHFRGQASTFGLFYFWFRTPLWRDTCTLALSTLSLSLNLWFCAVRHKCFLIYPDGRWETYVESG